MSNERLVDLIGNAPIGVNGITLLDKHEPKVIEEVADYLIANGVVVPPCKVGDTVYEIVHGVVGETEAVGFIVCQDGAILLITKHFFPLSREIGESVFLTREELEAKLKESENNA
jgi:hypothetical protein